MEEVEEDDRLGGGYHAGGPIGMREARRREGKSCDGAVRKVMNSESQSQGRRSTETRVSINSVNCVDLVKVLGGACHSVKVVANGFINEFDDEAVQAEAEWLLVVEGFVGVCPVRVSVHSGFHSSSSSLAVLAEKFVNHNGCEIEMIVTIEVVVNLQWWSTLAAR
ncbi:hypothetical protein Droror1_Dr00024491 [Drosera rotundifolia]